MPFDLSVDLTTLAILAVVAFIAGFIDAIAGGGGLLTTPALLTAGLPPHLVLGTNKLSSTFGSATASFTFYRRKLFHPSQWKLAIFGTLAGALIGAVTAHFLPAEWLNKMLPVIVFGCGLYLLFGGTPKAPLDSDAPIRKKWQLPQGFSLGFYDGVAGPGTGAFWTVSSMLLYPIDLVKASGVARSMNFVSNIAALSVFVFSGQVDWIIGLSMGISVMAGAFFGARTAISGGAKFIRPVFITVVLGLTVRLAWQHWFSVA
ncbi:TSUP family transporter [Pseudomonas gingeri]|uniref:TSUP family transporter n=1 Tax=Pseudomonas gingeri TaxID=117681 RepID=UPI0015A0B9EF|nr:TSUP family transporter [Pseudomonas gingeri]NWA02999.1 TSUP family transporter [Pseudomonas gingeri]NWA17276.1 TSUP family transporter [Pseudomonas gingeri]NWA57860.1 TSUP family transporter [Pseudomonas gingeri]NWA98760.1 TSUP family transporter [Pseudomonas gingeri]NWB02420.1 TSUP family transporter [Pseudomonas gingeri]